MKVFILIVAIFCYYLSLVDGLQCVISGPNIDTSNSKCLFIDKYCYTATIKEKISNAQHQITIQGCSGKVELGYGIGVCSVSL
uniref:UPAR/Ly6 domain-containing protein n=1 Tax=Panagrolaimus davidi TaxID=227884 RepID=A0A914PP32_9BILA